MYFQFRWTHTQTKTKLNINQTNIEKISRKKKPKTGNWKMFQSECSQIHINQYIVFLSNICEGLLLLLSLLLVDGDFFSGKQHLLEQWVSLMYAKCKFIRWFFPKQHHTTTLECCSVNLFVHSLCIHCSWARNWKTFPRNQKTKIHQLENSSHPVNGWLMVDRIQFNYTPSNFINQFSLKLRKVHMRLICRTVLLWRET